MGRFLSLVVLALMTACGSSSNEDAGLADAAEASDGGIVTDSGSSGDVDASTTDAGPSTVKGEILVEQTLSEVGQAQVFTTRLTAYFARTATPATSVCTSNIQGRCRLVECGAGAPESLQYLNAGTVRVTGGELAGPLVAQADNNVRYLTAVSGRAFSPENDRIEYNVSGGPEVTQFNGAIVSPAEIELTMDTIDRLSTINRSADFALQWTIQGNGESGLFEYQLRQLGSAGASKTLICDFDPSIGTASVPQAMLSSFGAGEAQLRLSTLRGLLVARRSITVSLSNAMLSLSVTLQ